MFAYLNLFVQEHTYSGGILRSLTPKSHNRKEMNENAHKIISTCMVAPIVSLVNDFKQYQHCICPKALGLHVIL